MKTTGVYEANPELYVHSWNLTNSDLLLSKRRIQWRTQRLCRKLFLYYLSIHYPFLFKTIVLSRSFLYDISFRFLCRSRIPQYFHETKSPKQTFRLNGEWQYKGVKHVRAKWNENGSGKVQVCVIIDFHFRRSFIGFFFNSSNRPHDSLLFASTVYHKIGI